MASAEPQPGDIVAQKYRVERVLGRGGMGIVCAARHELTDKPVALKWMLPTAAAEADMTDRFLREARAAGRVESPNVVSVYDVLLDGDAFVLVMELLRGETLTSVLQRGELDRAELLRILAGAMRGVAAAHARGVVHRDLKPDNIFVQDAQPGVPALAKVLDFGISKLVPREGERVTMLTRTGAVLGTPRYMSPEQARGDKDIDHRTDVYAFGVILYEALTGRPPFTADTYAALMIEILSSEPPRPTSLRPDLPESLEAVVMKAMAREPAERYATMEALIADVERHTSDATGARLPGANTRPSLTPLTAEAEAAVIRPATRRARMAALAGGGLLLLLAAWLFYPPPAAAPEAGAELAPEATAEPAPPEGPGVAAPIGAPVDPQAATPGAAPVAQLGVVLDAGARDEPETSPKLAEPATAPRAPHPKRRPVRPSRPRATAAPAPAPPSPPAPAPRPVVQVREAPAPPPPRAPEPEGVGRTGSISRDEF